MRELETSHTKIAALRVLGLETTALLDTLFSTVHLLSARNLYPRACAAMLDRGLRATECALRVSLDR